MPLFNKFRSLYYNCRVWCFHYQGVFIRSTAVIRAAADSPQLFKEGEGKKKEGEEAGTEGGGQKKYNTASRFFPLPLTLTSTRYAWLHVQQICENQLCEVFDLAVNAVAQKQAGKMKYEKISITWVQ